MMNQYKDPRELRELAQPLHQVEGFGQGNRAVQVSCGDSFTLVLNERNQLFSFGKTSHGRLGLGGNLKSESQHQPTLLDSMGSERVVQLSAGCRHAACVTD
jgi:alpha-tubulin suppressor-like RCC1 family protein